ncbi:MAG: tetratricopeptide repeat protein [Nitrospira sp.]|nr:tetratricopeptide repeat protein [Nitrospira sp.]
MIGSRRVVVGLLRLLVLGACAASPPLATTAGADPITSAHNEAGIAQFNAGRWDAAREHCAAAIQADPRSAASQYNLVTSPRKTTATQN